MLLITKFTVGFDLAASLSSPFPSCIADVEQCQNICELVFGVNIFDLVSGVQIDSTEQPVASNSVGPGNMFHSRASSLYDYLDHCFVVFKDVQSGPVMRRFLVEETQIDIRQFKAFL